MGSAEFEHSVRKHQEGDIYQVEYTKKVVNYMKGKHYKRGMRLYKLTYEALARLLLADVCREDNLPESVSYHLQHEQTDVGQKFNSLLDDSSLRDLLIMSVEQASESPMSSFWVSFLEMVEILFLNYHSLRSQNWEEYLSSLRLMLPWIAAYDSLNYSSFCLLVCDEKS